VAARRERPKGRLPSDNGTLISHARFPAPRCKSSSRFLDERSLPMGNKQRFRDH
jgi:hypothetical protein